MTDDKYDLDAGDIITISPLLPWLNNALHELGLAPLVLEGRWITDPYMHLDLRAMTDKKGHPVAEFAYQLHVQIASTIWDGFRHTPLSIEAVIASVRKSFPNFDLGNIDPKQPKGSITQPVTG